MKYIHIESDPPPSVIKQIPKSIATRLFSLPLSEEKFHEGVPHYEDRLGFQFQIQRLGKKAQTKFV